jgi:hypothetical protein
VRLGRFALEGDHRHYAYIDVFGSDRVGNCEVYVMNGDGSAFTQLTDNAVDDFIPVWSLGPWVSRMTQPRQGLPRPGVSASWARFCRAVGPRVANSAVYSRLSPFRMSSRSAVTEPVSYFRRRT